MGYFSELLITAREREEQLYCPDPIENYSFCYSPVLQACCQLESLADRLKEQIFWDNLRGFQLGRPIRNWKTVYKEWPEYWNDERTDLMYWPVEALDEVDEILAAIAQVQKKLFLYGYNADAEAEKMHRTVSAVAPLEGQIRLLPVA